MTLCIFGYIDDYLRAASPELKNSIRNDRRNFIFFNLCAGKSLMGLRPKRILISDVAWAMMYHGESHPRECWLDMLQRLHVFRDVDGAEIVNLDGKAIGLPTIPADPS